ncbi:sulfatase [Halalkalibaculum sp. DA384]|uniref:sulfatase n=1 Tax=Halalkalibaculum sp. DA384 TaxID=3373606 RepID=UPI003754AF53
MACQKYTLLLLASFGFLCATGPPARSEPPPNVLFILVDDLGWRDLGSYGSTFYETPHLDRLAATGIRFTDAYAAHPVCSPTRAAIMTGKDPTRVGITDWIPGMPTERAEDPQLVSPEDIHNLPLEELTIAEAFRQQGYRTFFAGKWHLGETPEYWPEHQGFEINKGGHDRGSPPGGYYAPYENPRLEDGPEGEYLTDRLTTEAIRFMEQASERTDPFFLFLSFYTVHTPIQGCARYDEHYREEKLKLPGEGKPAMRKEGLGQTRLTQSDPEYAAMVRCMDQNVGRLLKELKHQQLYENTIIVFTSDNGGLTTLPAERNIAPTAVIPLRAGKGWAYEGGIRVPLIIKAPGIQKGKVSAQPVTSMDFYPTLLELAGLPSQNQQHVDGKSLVPYLKDPAKVDDRTLVWHYPHYHGSGWRPGSAIRAGRWKLVEFYEETSVELYDLSRDLNEEHDLAGKYPDTAAALREQMHEYIKQRGGRYPVRRGQD